MRHLPTLDSITKAIRRHETGESTPDELYSRLYCLTYQSTTHELFGTVDEPADIAQQTFRSRSHKFIPAFVGADVVRRVVDEQHMQPTDQWLDCWKTDHSHPEGACELYAWPFGVLMLHVTEELAFPNVAGLAVWRRSSYEDDLIWAAAELQALTGIPDVEAPYVLGIHWLLDTIWSGEDLTTALRLICMPRVLLERDDEWDGTSGQAHAELVERALFREGFEHPEMVEFGIKGISHAFASWSGVVYHPTAPDRALPESDLVTCELAAQAIWSYCHHIRDRVEHGNDPDIEPEYGWRFLRAVRSRLVNPRPQETGQHRSMREAVLATSGLAAHLAEALEIVRESGG